MARIIRAFMPWMAGLATVAMLVGLVIIIRSHDPAPKPEWQLPVVKDPLDVLIPPEERHRTLREYMAAVRKYERAEWEFTLLNIVYVVGTWFGVVPILAMAWGVARIAELAEERAEREQGAHDRFPLEELTD